MSQNEPPKTPPKKVFLSCTYNDSNMVALLQTHLKALELSGLVEIWDSKLVTPDMKWRPIIQKAISEAEIVIMLVSTAYLASDYINTEELPQIEKGAGEGRLKIFIVHAKPCKKIAEIYGLNNYESITAPELPLSKMSENEIDETFDNLVGAIRDYISKQVV